MRWEKEIVYVGEGAAGECWHVLLTAPGIWVECGRFASREEAEAHEPERPPLRVDHELGERYRASAAGAVH